MIFFFPELFLLNSFLNEQEGNFFLYEWSQTELDLDALGSFYKSWLAYNFREKIFSDRPFFPLVSALAPVSWAVEGFFLLQMFEHEHNF